jgi:hypothetical protein
LQKTGGLFKKFARRREWLTGGAAWAELGRGGRPGGPGPPLGGGGGGGRLWAVRFQADDQD